VTALDATALDRIAAGDTLVLSPPPETLRPNSILGHTAAFWNTLWTDGQAPHTLGLLVDSQHPLFEQFPSADHTDWHWWELTHLRRAFDMQGLENKAIVRVVDDWNSNRDLVLCAEMRLGQGRLILVAFDLEHNLDDRPVARTFHAALAAYLNGQAIEAPEVTRQTILDWWEGVRQ